MQKSVLTTLFNCVLGNGGRGWGLRLGRPADSCCLSMRVFLFAMAHSFSHLTNYHLSIAPFHDHIPWLFTVVSRWLCSHWLEGARDFPPPAFHPVPLACKFYPKKAILSRLASKHALPSKPTLPNWRSKLIAHSSPILWVLKDSSLFIFLWGVNHTV